jgi:hypothetical protein
MKEVYTQPPNIADIVQFVNPTEQTIFAYGDTLYNPHRLYIYPDLWVHEQVHQHQQEAFGTPELWWAKYLRDKAFRLEQEVEAYATQYNYVKKYAPQAAKEALFDFASSLSSPMYAVDITYQQAENMVRLRSKQI